MGLKILGISGSYRKDSGTGEAVREALKGAASIDPEVETDFISLRKKDIAPCIHCDGCWRKQSLCIVKDDFQELQQRFLEADGYIIGSPVYNMNYTPVLDAFFSRMRPVYLEYPGHFTRRIGAAIAVGANRNGGQEMVLINIQNFFSTYEILTCGGTFHDPGGTCLVTVDGSYEEALKDSHGMKSAFRVGQRLAQSAALLKFGEEEYDRRGYALARTSAWYEV